MYGGESELHKLFTFSRHSYLFIYGQQYPAEQHQDDLENYCPLELIHQDYLFRYRIWRLAERYYRGKVIQSELETLWTEINIFKKVSFISSLLLQMMWNKVSNSMMRPFMIYFNCKEMPLKAFAKAGLS